MSYVSKPEYTVHYADNRSCLQIEANLDLGWRKLEKTYGFFRNSKIPYREDITVRAAVSLTAQPAGFDESASQFPDITLDSVSGDVSIRLQQRTLVIKVPLSADQPWRQTKQGRPELFIEELPLFSSGKHSFDLRVWVVCHEGSRRPMPDVRVWVENKLVIPGGQFESNRRKH